MDSNENPLDWEYREEFYNEKAEKPVHSFEEIAKESQHQKEYQSEWNLESLNGMDDRLIKTIQDVREVKELSVRGKTIEEIALSLQLSQEYVSNILMNAEGYPKDNDIAVAHLVLMG